MSLVACIFVPESHTEFALRDAKTTVNGKIIALPETIRLDIQQLDLAIRESDANIKRALGFDVLAYNTPFL